MIYKYRIVQTATSRRHLQIDLRPKKIKGLLLMEKNRKFYRCCAKMFLINY